MSSLGHHATVTALLTGEQNENVVCSRRAAEKARAEEEARRTAMTNDDWATFHDFLVAQDCDDSDVPYALRGLNIRYGVREPWLLHGLPTFRYWLTPEDEAVYQHRLEVSDALYETGWPGTPDGGGRLLFAEFCKRDREDYTSWRPFKASRAIDYASLALALRQRTDEKGAKEALAYVEARTEEEQPGIVDRRKEARFKAALNKVSDGHDDHWFFAHPFCRECFPSKHLSVEGYYASWLLKQPSDDAYPSYDWDGQVPPVPVIPDEIAFLTDADLAERPETGWLVDGILPDAGTGILRARDQSFKSFMALSWALQVVVDGGKVLYCVGEGVNQFSQRRDAWLEHHGFEVEDLEDNLHYADRVPNLFTGDGAFDAVLARARREQYDLVIIDTYARAAAGSDLNSQGDQSLVTARVDEIKRAAGGTVLLVAHSQKSDTDSSGSIEIEDARDFIFAMKRSGNEVTFEVTKQKDGVESAKPQRYVAEPVAQSIVLVEAGGGSDDPLMTAKDWIVAALEDTRALGPQTEAEIRSWVNTHEQRRRLGHKELTKSTSSSSLSRLVESGVVTKTGKTYLLAGVAGDAR